MLQRLKHWWRRLRSPRGSATGAIILMYHRVADPPVDPCLLCVGPQQFAEQMEILRQHYDVLRLQECRQLRVNGTSQRPRVIVTFDDGYRDNLVSAKPILQRYEVPATVFVTSGFVGTEREFWWDELDRLLLQPGSLPPKLILHVNEELREWDLGDVADYSSERQSRCRHWSFIDPDDPTPRQRIYRDLVQVLYTMPLPQRHALLEELRVEAKAEANGRPSHLAMTPSQVQELAEGGLVEIGAHTITHPVLSAQPVELQRQEIQESQRRLQDIVSRPVRSFAYPFGTRTHYGPETVTLVREAGFTCACSNFTGFVLAEGDPFQLPRFMVFNWNGDEFARKLRQWFAE